MPQCPDHRATALVAKKKGWFCGVCDDVVLTFGELPPVDDAPATADRAARLPTLLALPLHELEVEPSPAIALWAACDLAEIALKMCVMAGIAEHVSVPSSLVREVRSRVELPTLGKWLGMAQAVERHSPQGCVLPLKAMVRSLEDLLGGGDATASMGLLALRNRLAHGGPVRRQEAATLLSTWRPRVLAWADQSLGWLIEARLIVVDAIGRRFLMCGSEGEETVSDAQVPADAPAGSAWLCVGGRGLPLGPLGAFDPDQRVLQVYVRRGEVRLQYLCLGEQGGICDSGPSAFHRFRDLFLTGAGDARPRQYKIRDFDDEIRREAARRVGRDVELRMLVEAIRQQDGGAVWVGGPAGIGKSNLVAAATVDLLDAPPEATVTLPYRFRAGDDRCGRNSFLEYLRERLEASDALMPEAETTEDVATKVVDDPVQGVRRLLARLERGYRIVLILDGLDEVVERDPRFVEDVVFRLAHERVVIVGAGRPERGIPESFLRRFAANLFPDGLPPMSEDDVRALLLERTGPVRKRLLARDREAAGTSPNAFVAAVATRSEGLPIYVNYVVGDLNSGRLSPETLDALPAGLHAYHDELLRRASIGDLQAVTTPTLVLLALAHEPLTIEELAALLVRRGALQSADATLMERAVAALASMLRRSLDPDGEEGFALFHHSLRTHVLAAADLSQTVGVTRAALADMSCVPAGDAAEVYLYRNGVRHMLDADRRDDAIGVQTDFELVMQRFHRLESTGRAADEWYADWERLRRGPNFEGTAHRWWSFARTNRHQFRNPGWESWRVLFQAAMDCADDSPVTCCAERYYASGRVDWAWLRWLNRPPCWHESPLLAVCLGAAEVEGALELADGRLLSWSDDGRLWLWDGVTGAPLHTLEGHRGHVRGAEMLRDGRILSWATDGTLRLWDGATGALLDTLTGHSDGEVGARTLSDGRILSWSKDATLRLWDVLNGAPPVVLRGHVAPVGGADVLPDGRLLSWSHDRTMRIWSAEGDDLDVVLKGHSGRVTGVRTLGDGRILSWSSDATLRLWDGASGESLAVLEGHSDGVLGVLVCLDGRLLSWSEDGTLRYWNAESGENLAILNGDVGEVAGVLELAGGRVLSWYGSSAPYALRLWAADGQSVATLEGHTLWPTGACETREGRIVSSAMDDELRLWDGRTGEPLATLEGHSDAVTGVQVLSDGRLLSWSIDGTLRLWDTRVTPPTRAPNGHTQVVQGARWLADGRLLSWSSDATLRVWDRVTGAPVAVLKGHRERISGVVLLPEERVLSWSDDAKLLLWDVPACSLIGVFEGHDDDVHGAMVLPDGRVLSWSNDHTLMLWDAATCSPLAVLIGHTDAVTGAEVLPDGRILSWSEDRTLRLWNPLGAPLATLEGHSDAVNGALALPDGRLLSWAGSWKREDHNLLLWDGQNGSLLESLVGHVAPVTGALVVPDGRILSWSWDGSLRIWDGSSGSLVATLEGHEATIRGARLLGDDSVLSWSFDRTVRRWSLSSSECLNVFLAPRDWTGEDAASTGKREQVPQHALEDGLMLLCQDGDWMACSFRKEVRICRFVSTESTQAPS